MKLKEVKNKNYCATIAKISNIVELDNCDNVQAAIVLGSQVIVSKDTKKDDVGIFFPIECKLSDEYLSNNNLYRHVEKNKDNDKVGYFEDNGRLKAVKFRGNKSEGLFMPLESLDFISDKLNLKEGDDFDEINGIPICEKYIVKRSRMPGQGEGKKPIGRVSRLVDNQFRLHRDTEQLKRNIEYLKIDDLISITSKLHGTSAVFGNILVKRKLKLREKIARLFGVKIQETEYDLVYSSRKVVKNEYFFNKKSQEWRNAKEGYYGLNVWEKWANKIREFVPKGMSVYGEIVGYIAEDSFIQKGYHYGCENGESELYIYRITQTNEDGNVTELTRLQIDEFCKRNGLNATPLLYYGHAYDLYRSIEVDDNWPENFLAKLTADELFGMNDSMCTLNNNEVPAEGVVVRIEGLYNPTPFKLKNYAFLEHETKILDEGEEDIEESVE